jgi:hypothetical protein
MLMPNPLWLVRFLCWSLAWLLVGADRPGEPRFGPLGRFVRRRYDTVWDEGMLLPF